MDPYLRSETHLHMHHQVPLQSLQVKQSPLFPFLDYSAFPAVVLFSDH